MPLLRNLHRLVALQIGTDRRAGAGDGKKIHWRGRENTEDSANGAR